MTRAINFLTSGYFIVGTGVSAIFAALIAYMPMDTVIITLNGLFFGGLATIGFAYGELIVRAIRGDLVGYGAQFRQMVVCMLGGWLAFGLLIGASVWVHATDMSSNAMFISALGRVLAIVSAVGQITAPNLGEPFLFGRDRKLLWASMAFGLLFSVVVILVQATAAFAWPL